MKVKCLYNLGKYLPRDLLAPAVGDDEERKYDLIVGKEYLVYAMELHRGYMWYYILDESKEDKYPLMYPSPLFEVVDGHLSKYWIYNFEIGENICYSRTIFAFPEWAHKRGFDVSLHQGDKKEIEIFEHYKDLMDKEFE